jgi:hypothetical protein
MMARTALIVAALTLGVGTASAQTPSSSAPSGDSRLGGDASRNAGAERDQQFAIDNLRDEAGTTTNARPSRRNTNRIVAATTADLLVGATVHDSSGAALGTIEAVKPDGVQLLSGSSRAMIPSDVFAVKGNKLMLNVTRAEYEKQTGAAK